MSMCIEIIYTGLSDYNCLKLWRVTEIVVVMLEKTKTQYYATPIRLARSSPDRKDRINLGKLIGF